MQDICCPVCKSASIDRGIEKYREYTLYWCKGCDLQWWHPLENPGAGFYEETCCVLRDAFSFADELLWEHQQFFRYLPKAKGRLLDIGCGTGRFLYEIKRRGLELQPIGLDFDGKAVEVARNSFGLGEVYAMSLEEFMAKNPGSFEVITLFEVLEHQWDPAGLLERIRELLVPGGYIVLGLPNRNTWGGPPGWDHPPMHLSRWSTRALRSFLEKGGFSVILVMEAPASFVEARALISARIGWVSYMEDVAALRFKKVAVETHNLDGYPTVRKLAGRALGVLRLFRKAMLFTPALFLSATARASSKKGQTMFCIARKANR